MKKHHKNTYIAGILLGVLAIVSAVATTILLGKSNYLNVSTSFVQAAGFIEEFFAPTSTSSISYYVAQQIEFDWQFMLVVGITIGAFASSLINGTFKIEWVPPIWKERFGNSIGKRAVMAFAGGIFTMYGARLADGGLSGHGLSGVMQLSVSSFLALFLFVLVGALFSDAMYKGGVK